MSRAVSSAIMAALLLYPIWRVIRFWPRGMICPLLSGPKLMIFWITKEIMNAEQEASPGRD